MAAVRAAWQPPGRMKAFFVVLILVAALAAALFVPLGGRSFWQRAQAHGIPRAIARGTAHGLRAGWDFLASLSHRTGSPESPAAQPTREPPAHSPRHASRKAQAATAQPVQRTSREGIVAQPPREKLGQSDRAALDDLVAHAR